MGVKSGEELLKKAERALPELYQISKGIPWGERLMSFAWENPEIKDEETGATQTRPIVEAINAAIRAVIADYHLTRTRLRVDPISGKPVERES